MTHSFSLRSTAKAALVLISASALVHTVSTQAADKAASKKAGAYVSGDFHNHTTCSDGSLSLQKLVDKATGNKTGAYNLDWFIQTDHGGSSARNCTIAEDPFEPNTPALGLSASTVSPSNATPAGSPTTTLSPTSVNPYPSAGQSATLNKGPNQTWFATLTGGATIKGAGTSPASASTAMYRWQEIKEYQYKVLENESRNRKKPIWIGSELVAPGHEHYQVTVLDGQATWPSSSSSGNATLMAQHEYCFDNADGDTSRGAENQWNCSVSGSLNSNYAGWNDTAKKILGSNGSDTSSNATTTLPGGVIASNSPGRGHYKSVEALKWLKEKSINTSFYIPAHIERAGKYSKNQNRGTDIEHFREFNNIAPTIAFGFESMPGHQPNKDRGEYYPGRYSDATAKAELNTDSAAGRKGGGRTFGGTGGYAADVGGVWDALLGEGRNWWFFASSDYHNRGIYGPDQLESTFDFYPGEYTKMYVMSRNGSDNLSPQSILDGLRSGNVFVANGGVIDRLSFVVCRYNPTMPKAVFQSLIEKASLAAAQSGKEVRIDGCATMGEKLKARANTELLVTVVARNPKANNSPYSFPNPSLAQIGVSQPLNAPVLDHVDMIWGQVTKKPMATPVYAEGLDCATGNPDPNFFSCGNPNSPAAVNPTTVIAKRFNTTNWVNSGNNFITMSYKVSAGKNSQYFRLRGTNLPPSTPYETDADGNPLTDDTTTGKTIECKSSDCPKHLATSADGTKKYSSYDVAAWADLWFYSNPVFVEIVGDVTVAGAK